MTKQTADRTVKDEIHEEKLDSISGGRRFVPQPDQTLRQVAELDQLTQPVAHISQKS